MFNHPLFRLTIIFLILLELLSFTAWLFPVFNAVCFFTVLAVVFAISLINLKYGLLVTAAELVVGSFGYLFSFNYGATWLSLRFGLFVIIILAWLIGLLRQGELINFWQGLKKFIFFKYYLVLAVILLWGFVSGLVRGHNFGYVFLDFNNFLCLPYLLPLLTVFTGRRDSGLLANKVAIAPGNISISGRDNAVSSNQQELWRDFIAVLLGSLIMLIFNTFFLFYIFSHNFLFAWHLGVDFRRIAFLGKLTFQFLCLLTLAIWGWPVWHAFIESLPLTRHIIIEAGATGWEKIQSPFAAVRQWGGSIPAAYVAQAIVSALAIAMAALVARRGSMAVRGAAALSAALLCTPYVLDYDFVLLGVAIAFMMADMAKRGPLRWEPTWLAYAWIAPLFGRREFWLLGLRS